MEDCETLRSPEGEETGNSRQVIVTFPQTPPLGLWAKAGHERKHGVGRGPWRAKGRLLGSNGNSLPDQNPTLVSKT